MKRFVRVSLFAALFAILFCSLSSFCQDASKAGTSDPYKPTLDRLQSLTRQPESDWRVHSDVPHPENPGLDDSGWEKLTVKNISGPGGKNPDETHWTGTHVFRRWI